jgi:hypothetical protein
MIFVGDIALPYVGAIKLSNTPIELKKKNGLAILKEE